jgi:hypothetical protein
MNTDLYEAVHQALRLWHKAGTAGAPLESLALYQRALYQTGSVRRASNQILWDALEVLEGSNPQEATLLRERFLNDRPTHTLATEYNVGESKLYALQRHALHLLAEVIQQSENSLNASHQKILESRLPFVIPSLLIGVSDALDRLTDLLKPGSLIWIVALEGIGGIGKTSLADALVRRLLVQGVYPNIGWVSAQQLAFGDGILVHLQTGPALTTEMLVRKLGAQLLGDVFLSAPLSAEGAIEAVRHQLKTTPHLVVVDNLETFEDVDTLLPLLRSLAEPSKFLLTSRYHVVDRHVTALTVPQLSEKFALRLIRRESELVSHRSLEEVTDAELQPIYTAVGGNPLAIRLVVGQAFYYGLDAVLEDLYEARGQEVESLYTYLYFQAWKHLDEVAQQVFLAMPLVSDAGGDMRLLMSMVEMPSERIRPALKQLVSLNLVDVGGSLMTPRYTIHNLTRTFLQKQIAKWHPQPPH